MRSHDPIDRIAPTLEPDQPVLMDQNWIQRAGVAHFDETLVRAAGVRWPEAVPLRHCVRQVNVKVDPPERVV